MRILKFFLGGFIFSFFMLNFLTNIYASELKFTLDLNKIYGSINSYSEKNDDILNEELSGLFLFDNVTKQNSFLSLFNLYRFADTKARTSQNLTASTVLYENQITQPTEVTTKKTLKVGNKSIKLEDTSAYVFSTFGRPIMITKSNYGWDWHVYYTDYTDLILIGIEENKVVALVSNAKTFVYDDRIMPGTLKENVTEGPLEMYFYDGNIVEGVYLALDYTRDSYQSVSLGFEIFFLTNAFRVKQNLPYTNYDQNLEKAAVYHSKDMAQNSFFGHVGPGKSTPLDRILSTGLIVIDCAENLAKGYGDGVFAFEGLINSDYHREAIVGKHEVSGVGAYVTGNGEFFYTQLFANVYKGH